MRFTMYMYTYRKITLLLSYEPLGVKRSFKLIGLPLQYARQDQNISETAPFAYSSLCCVKRGSI